MSFMTQNRDHLIAGLCGGFASTLIVHPLDLVRIRYSVNEGNYNLRPQYSGYFDLAKTIIRTRGFVGLYQGATPNIIGNTVSWGLYFYLFNCAKEWLQYRVNHETLSAPGNLVCGFGAGLLTLIVTNPIWVAKTRLCLQYEDRSAQYRGMVDALRHTFKVEGVRGWYKGFVPGMFGTSHGAIQFMAYEELKKMNARYCGTSVNSKLSNGKYLIFAAISKTFAVATTYPYQVIRFRLQDQHSNYDGVVDAVRRTFNGEGVTGFYKGMLPSLVRVVPATVVTFLVYENVRHFLKPIDV